MRNTAVIFFVMILLIAKTTIMNAETSVQSSNDLLMAKWTKALAQENLKAYESCYWPESVSYTFDATGQLSTVKGLDEIIRRQKSWFDAFDYSSIGFAYPEPTRFLPSMGDISVYLYLQKSFNEIAVFYFQKRNSEVRILTQIDVIYEE
jgi:hypothetical protein